MCIANASAVLQLLVHSPLFWNQFEEIGYLKGQRGAGGQETGGAAAGATPLVDATVRFFEEFTFKEPLQQAASGNQRKHDKTKERGAVDSFEPTYICDAMKEKRQFRNLLVRSRASAT
jgi:ubiquitin carboxyl-terminal hydrolase 10